MVQISLLYVQSRTEVSGLLWTSTYPKVTEFSNQIQEKSDLKIFLGPFFLYQQFKNFIENWNKRKTKKYFLGTRSVQG